jgi:hypothetical protein
MLLFFDIHSRDQAEPSKSTLTPGAAALRQTEQRRRHRGQRCQG